MIYLFAVVALGYVGFAIYHIWDRPGFLTAAVLSSYSLAVFFGSLGGILGLTAIFAVACAWATRSPEGFRSTPAELALLLWTLVTVASVFAGYDFDSSKQIMNSLVVLSGGAYVLGRTFGESDQFIDDFIDGSIVVLMICIPGVLLSVTSQGSLDLDQNTVGLAVSVEAPLVGALTLLMFGSLKRRMRQALIGLVFLVFLPFAFVLGNRSLLLANGLAFLLFFAIRLRRGNSTRLVISAVIAVALIAGAAAILLSQLSDVAGARIVSLGIARLTGNFTGATENGLAIDPSAQSRLQMYSDAVRVISQAPVLGHGLGSFGFLVSYVTEGAYPHNLFLEIAVDTGFIGLLLFLCALVPTGWYAFSRAWAKGADWRLVFIAGLLLETLIRHQASMSVTAAKVLFFALGLANARWAAEKRAGASTTSGSVLGASVAGAPELAT